MTTPRRRSTREKKPSRKVAAEGKMPDAVGNRPGRVATPNAKKPAASSSARRSKKTNSGGTTASGQLAVSLSNTNSTSVGKPKAKKKPTVKYYNLDKRMIARAFGLLNESVRCMTHEDAQMEPGYQLIADGVSPEGMNTACCAWNSHRSNVESGRRAREKCLKLLRTATSKPPLHPDLDAKLYTSQDGSVIGVPSLGGVQSMSFYTKDGAPVTDPARLQELEAERQVAAAAAANAGTPSPAGAPTHVAAAAASNAANVELSNKNAEHISGLLTISERHEGRLCKVEDRVNDHGAVLSNHDRRIGNNEEDIKDLRNTLKRHGIDPSRQQPDSLHQLTNVGDSTGAVDSPRASSKPSPNVIPPTIGAAQVIPLSNGTGTKKKAHLLPLGAADNGNGLAAGCNAPPSAPDRKPSARPSPKRLFAATGGTGSGADVSGSFGARDSVGNDAGVLIKAAPVTDRAVPSISFAETSPAPREDLNEWASKMRLSPGNRVNGAAVRHLLRPYVKDSGINITMRKDRATKHDEHYVQSIGIALTAIKPFPFAQYCVYRGMKAKTPEAVLNFKSLMEKRELFVEPGLLSASALYPLPPSFQNMNTHFAIRSKSGRLIQAFSNRKDEWEVLHPAGTSFRILSFEDTEPGGSHGSPGRYKIVMEEVEEI
jgi:hypothetical protein